MLFATSPWAIYYAVGIYNPIPTIFFGALLFLSLYNSVSNEQDRAIFWVCVLAAALPHFHMVTLFLYPAIVFILWKSRSQINIKFFTFGIAAGITLYLPYLIGDGLNGWENTKLILSGENKPFSFSVMKVITAPITMLSNAPTGWIGRELDDHQGYFEFGTKYFGHYSVLLILNLINLSIILSLFFRFSFRGFISFKEGLLSTESYKNNRTLIFLFLLIITPLLIYLITGRNFATRYTLIILSLLFIMKVLVISKLLNPKASKLITSYFFINIILSVYIVITYNNYMEMMINESKSFYPSIYKLEKIKENIYSEFKTPVHVDVKLSKEILNMPESQQKLYRAVREYIDVENRKTPKDTSDKRELLVVKTGESYDVQKYKKIIYKSPSIVILW